MIWLHCLKIWWTSVQQLRSLRGAKAYIPIFTEFQTYQDIHDDEYWDIPE